MSRNGSGTYLLPVGNPVVTGTTITSNWANTTLSDIGTALTGSVASDGQTPITGNLQMGGNKITGMANGTALTDAATVAQAVPTGAILMWSGSIATIPSGWLICDGTNGTPDLRSRFIVGAGSTYAVNATGGSADATLVSHTHTFSGNTGGMNQNTVHSHGISDPGHTHSNNTIVGNGGGGSALSVADPVSNEFPTPRITTNGALTGITVNAVNLDHLHGYSGTTSSAGSSATNANLPPYLALAYIMKA
jgi:hypothetical protein